MQLFPDVDRESLTWALNQVILGVQGQSNIVSADPTAASDNTMGYTVGTMILNTTNNRIWRALSVGTGAAVWALEGVVPGLGSDPSNMITQFGSGTGVFYEEGNLFRASGAPYYTQIGTAQDIVLAAYTLPANSFDGLAGTNRGLTITAQGNFAANGNNKTTKIIYNPSTAVQGSAVVGGVTLATTGVSAGNNVGWQLMANVFKYGAANSNTQMGNMAATVVGTTHGGIGLSQALTATENGPIIIAVTGNGVAASDVSLWFAEVNAMN